jgi:prepilin-type N-terminal cleavage/methylation domain-containing protein
MNPRRAFTLIEVLAVVALLGLLAGATAWSLAGAAQRATFDEVAGRIAHADRMARFAGQRIGRPTVLTIDLDKQWLIRRIAREDGSVETAPALGVPRDMRIERVVLAGEPRSGDMNTRRPGRHIDRGQVEIAYSTHGRSVTYGLRLEGEDDSRWLVFAGLTGQMTEIDDEDEVDNLFELLTSGRPDAD